MAGVKIHWDNRLWRLTTSRVQAETRKWVADNKGKSSKKFILADPVIDLDSDDVKPGFFRLQMTNRNIPLLDVVNHWMLVPRVYRELELAIVQTAIEQGLLSHAVSYSGKPAVPKQDATISTDISTIYGFVYLIRNGDLFKIGITENLSRRLSELGPDEVLDVVRCDNYKELEKLLHRQFRKRRIPQTEYFRLNGSELAMIHAAFAQKANRQI